MLNALTRRLQERDIRILLVETAETEDFDYVRSFYQKHGFEEELAFVNFIQRD